MTDMNFRGPEAPDYRTEMSGEVLVLGGERRLPEEFGTFLLGSPKVRQAFVKHHRDLLTAKFWQQTKAQIQAAGAVSTSTRRDALQRLCRRLSAPRQASGTRLRGAGQTAARTMDRQHLVPAQVGLEFPDTAIGLRLHSGRLAALHEQQQRRPGCAQRLQRLVVH